MRPLSIREAPPPGRGVRGVLPPALIAELDNDGPVWQGWTLQDWTLGTMTDRYVKPVQLLIVGLCSEVDETGGPFRATHLWNALMVTVGLLKCSRQELESKRA